MSDDITYPSALAQREDGLIARRREQAGDIASDQPRFALALSGGGIRSATFSLGVLQALARAGLLRRFDYLSTVSGGGYIGGFLGSLYARRALPVAGSTPAAAAGRRSDQVAAILSDTASPPLHWLRENGRYLTPNGAGDALLAAAFSLRNWVSVLVVMATLALAAFLSIDALGLLLARLEPEGEQRWFGAPAGGGLVWWSPWLPLPALPLLLWAVPCGWAYWLVASKERPPGLFSFLIANLPTITTAVCALAPLAWWLGLIPGLPPATQAVTGLPWMVMVVVAAAALTPWVTLGVRVAAGGPPRVARRRLTDWLTAGLTLCGLLLVLGVIDSLGRSLYAAWAGDGLGTWLAAGLTGLTAGFAAVQRFASVLLPKGGRRRPPPAFLLLGAAAVLIHAGLLVLVCAAAHGISWGGKAPRFVPATTADHTVSAPLTVVDGIVTVRLPPAPAAPPAAPGSLPAVDWTLGGAAIAWALSFSFAWAMPFVNNSALAQIYAARLTRSYLGASNANRIDGGARITDVLPSDDLASGLIDADSGYHPEAQGGPLHLINLTINETVDGRSQLQQQDRKGLILAVGPAGMSVGARHHACPTGGGRLAACRSADAPRDEHPVFADAIQPEALSLGQLVGISGAAFSTGLGSRTSIALSLLCGLFNVRTGYWWDHDQGRFCLFGVQAFLLHEWLGRFPGTAWRHWYLSDGGHFENLACYELIRRRLPLIVCCDDGEDPFYAFEDVGALVRKARLDFGADIRFLDHYELRELLGPSATGFVGTLDDLRPQPAGEGQPATAKAHAALARVTYADLRSGLLLLLKPSLLGDESEDVRHYQRAHPAFPHEPTIDQFFDEAQWESYRRLGETIAGRLVDSGALPALMRTPMPW